MKIRRHIAHLALGGLLAPLLGICLTAGGAWAQTAMAPNAGDDNLRLDQSRAGATGNRNPPDSEDSAPDPETATTADPDEDMNATLDAATLKELRRQNPREETTDNLRPKQAPDGDLTPGIAMGTFTLRPALSETLGIERTRTGKDVTTRTYMQTGLKGSLTSDWALHQLKIDAEGTWQKTLSGIVEDDPEGKIEADLRLDISNVTTANLKVGYSLEREDISAANAIANATNQAQVSTYIAGSEITHDLGVLRATAGVDFSRQTYGDAQLENGQFVSQKDRNANTATLRGRLGYELSQLLIPFVEGSFGRTIYDEHKDTLGYIRDARLYAIKTGIEADFGEKLRGEISTGYALAEFDDPRLESISAITFDGKANWSPRRGTDVELGLRTVIEPSTTAGASGDVAYIANAAMTQVIIDTLRGRLNASTTFRDYSLPTLANQTVYNLGGGLTWGLSRSLDLNADIAWEKTFQPGVPRSEVFTAGIGLSLKR